MDENLKVQDAPAGLVDWAGEMHAVPAGWVPSDPKGPELVAIHKLLFERKLVDPLDGNEFRANEIRDIFRLGWYRTNLGISIGKIKKVGGYQFDAGLVCPAISPTTCYGAADYTKCHHSSSFFVKTPTTEREPVKLPRKMRDLQADERTMVLNDLRLSTAYRRTRAPVTLDAEWNLWMFNRHPWEVQKAHHVSALTWQVLSRASGWKGAAAAEVDAWTYVVTLELMYAKPGEVSTQLLEFVAGRIRDVVDVDRFPDASFQNYMLRYVFLAYWLGHTEEGWDAACEISKRRGVAFSNSPDYDCVLELRDSPEQFTEMLHDAPAKLLTHFLS